MPQGLKSSEEQVGENLEKGNPNIYCLLEHGWAAAAVCVAELNQKVHKGAPRTKHLEQFFPPG